MRRSSSPAGKRACSLTEKIALFHIASLQLSQCSHPVGFWCSVAERGQCHVSWGSAPQPRRWGKEDNVTSSEMVTNSHHIAQSLFPGGSAAALVVLFARAHLCMWESIGHSHVHLRRSRALLGWSVEPQTSLMDNETDPAWHRKEEEPVWAWKIPPSWLLPCQEEPWRNLCVFLTNLCKDSSSTENFMQLINLQGNFGLNWSLETTLWDKCSIMRVWKWIQVEYENDSAFYDKKCPQLNQEKNLSNKIKLSTM